MLERKDPTSWLKSVSAFANTQGGRLLFGVANDGSLAGLTDAQGDAEFISETIKAQMDPVPEIDLSIHVDWDVDRNVVRILDVVRDNPHITQREIATNLNLSLRGVEDMIKRAREKGLIRRVGGKRFGHWEVVR